MAYATQGVATEYSCRYEIFVATIMAQSIQLSVQKYQAASNLKGLRVYAETREKLLAK